MTKDEFAWLVVRAVGAFVLLLIFLDLINVALMAVQAAVLRNEVFSGSTNPDDDITMAIRYSRIMEQMIYLGIELIPNAAFSYYCFYRGHWIHSLLTIRQPSTEAR